jgi:predicted nucleic acid-binding protein
MLEIVLLDSGPLGFLSHPRPGLEILDWLADLVESRVRVLVPEIADYEVRRELIRIGSVRGIERLEHLKLTLGYVPITTPTMLQAARFWAQARNQGKPTAGSSSLDADVVLAAQAASFLPRNVVIATTNPKHLTRFVPAQTWQGIK